MKYILKSYTFFPPSFGILKFCNKNLSREGCQFFPTLILNFCYFELRLFPHISFSPLFSQWCSQCQSHCTGSLYISKIIIPPFALIKCLSSVNLFPLHSQMRWPSVLSSSCWLWHSCHSVNMKKKVFSTNCLKPQGSEEISEKTGFKSLPTWLQLTCVCSRVYPTCTKSTSSFLCSQASLEDVEKNAVLYNRGARPGL